MTTREPTGPSGSQQQLTWDTEGRLASWRAGFYNPTTTAQYLYDGEGNRVAQQVSSGMIGGPSTTTVYVGALETVATTSGITPTTTTTTYYYAAGRRIALAVNGTLSYLASDLLGSVSEALDTTGNATASQLYAPYGGVRYQSGTMPTDYGFTGQRADSTTGLDYYGARYYDPAVGQFISADTLLAGGLNRYGYVKGNPTSWVDPSGHEEELESELDGGGGGFGGGDGSNGDATVSGGVSGGGTGVSGSGDGAVGNSLTTGPQTGISDSVLEVENPDGSITYFDPTVTEGDLEAETQEINQTKQQLRDNDPQKLSNTPHTSDNSNDNGQNNGNPTLYRAQTNPNRPSNAQPNSTDLRVPPSQPRDINPKAIVLTVKEQSERTREIPGGRWH